MKSNTEELLDKLKNAKDIKEFLKSHENDFIKENSSSLMSDILAKKEISPSQAAKRSGVGNYVYKVISGERNASRNVIIAVAIGCKFSYEETQLLLRVSKFAMLDPRDKRDSVIIYAINNNLTVYQLDDMLDENGFDTVN